MADPMPRYDNPNEPPEDAGTVPPEHGFPAAVQGPPGLTDRPVGDSSDDGGNDDDGGGTVKDQVQQAATSVKDRAQQAKDQAQTRVRDEVDRRSTEVGNQLTAVATAVRSSGEQLRQEGNDASARLVERGADRIESLGDYLARTDGDALLRQVESYGQRHPWFVAGGGLLLGFAAARFLKASQSRTANGSAGSAPSNDVIAPAQLTAPPPPIDPRLGVPATEGR